MNRWIKPANFAGLFYPGSRSSLRIMLDQFEKEAGKKLLPSEDRVVGIVSPHAGYPYSGLIAAFSFHYAREQNPDTLIVLGLSHRVRLRGISVLKARACATPIGEVPCDLEFAENLEEKVPFSEFQREAHLSEHSVETQFPFIRRFFPDARVVEILTQDDSRPIPETVGKAIAETAQELDRKVLVVSSTDLSHYPPREVAEETDRRALEAVVSLDPDQAVREFRHLESLGMPGLSCAVCSKASVLAGMVAAKALGAQEGRLLGYTNSGSIPGGDPTHVVGYGAVGWIQPN